MITKNFYCTSDCNSYLEIISDPNAPFVEFIISEKIPNGKKIVGYVEVSYKDLEELKKYIDQLSNERI
jgi:hypothetical protein